MRIKRYFFSISYITSKYSIVLFNLLIKILFDKVLRTRDDNILPSKQIALKPGNENSGITYAANKLTKVDAVPVDQFKAFCVYEDVANVENEKPADKDDVAGTVNISADVSAMAKG